MFLPGEFHGHNWATSTFTSITEPAIASGQTDLFNLMINYQWGCMKLYISAEYRVWGRRINRLGPATLYGWSSERASTPVAVPWLPGRSYCVCYFSGNSKVSGLEARGSESGYEVKHYWSVSWATRVQESLPLQHAWVHDHGNKQADARMWGPESRACGQV